MDFTGHEIRDAARLLVQHYGEAVQRGRLEFYNGLVERLMEAVAGEAVAQQYMTADLAREAVPEAVKFVALGGKW